MNLRNEEFVRALAENKLPRVTLKTMFIYL